MSYDPKNRMHKVKYRDGDIQELLLRQEAVQYMCKDKAGEPRVRTDTRRNRDRSKRGSKSGAKRAREEGSTDDPPSKSNKSSSTRDEGVVGPEQAAVSTPGARAGGGSHDASAATNPTDDDMSGSELDSGELDSGDDSGMPSMSGQWATCWLDRPGQTLGTAAVIPTLSMLLSRLQRAWRVRTWAPMPS